MLTTVMLLLQNFFPTPPPAAEEKAASKLQRISSQSSGCNVHSQNLLPQLHFFPAWRLLFFFWFRNRNLARLFLVVDPEHEKLEVKFWKSVKFSLRALITGTLPCLKRDKKGENSTPKPLFCCLQLDHDSRARVRTGHRVMMTQWLHSLMC